MSLYEPEFESIAIMDMNGEALDCVGEGLDPSLIRDVAFMAFLASRSLGSSSVKKVVMDLGDRELVILIDPPLIRVGIVRRDRR